MEVQVASSRFSGVFGFGVVALGQVVSLMGSSMTAFALTIWAWQVTGTATALALVGFCAFFPLVLLSPIAGALVDRWNRKLVMILSDLAAGVGTIALFILLHLGLLEIWHIYVIAAFSGAFQAFQFPAFSASITMMVPKQQLTRANAMFGMARSIPTVFAPMAAGALIAFIHISGIMLIDIATFLFAIGALLVVRVPQPQRGGAESERRSLLSDSLFGFKYIFARPSLLGILLYFLVVNFLISLATGVLAPMLLARSGSSEIVLGTVQMAFGIGGVAGGLVLTAWGGPKRKMLGLVVSVLLGTLVGQTILGVGRGLVVWVIGALTLSFPIPTASAASHSIWQTKVPPHLQGRVFSARIMIGQIGGAIALPMSGLLADRVFEPLMRGDSLLANAFRPLVGTGPGSGMGLMFILFGILGGVASVCAYLYRPVRDIETLLPDCEPEAEAEAEETAVGA
jgi:DHA3 family macrolide efflux protein-like MFS transporter